MVDTITTVIDSFLSNQFATGLGVTAILGGLIYRLKSLPNNLWKLFLVATTVELTVYNREDAFEWIDKWLAKQPYAKRTRRVMLKSVGHNEAYPLSGPAEDWILTPGLGKHLFRWRNRLIYVSRETKDPANSPSPRQGGQHEFIHIRVLGRGQGVVRKLVEESKADAIKDDVVAIRMWQDDWWKTIRGKTPRLLETLTFKKGQIERILNDLAWFEGAKDWYAHRGIPYRRGYLFSGPPGTGKTSIVLALATHLNRPVCVLNLGSIFSDQKLFEAISEAPLDALILIEDIDCATSAQTREAEEDGKKDGEKETLGRISKAGLLNALDGLTTPDGRIFIMTTNYPDRLDPALIRPGRADVHEVFDHLGAEEQIQMAERFYGSGRFAPLDCPISPARMQAAFTMFPNSPEAAREFLLKQD